MTAKPTPIADQLALLRPAVHPTGPTRFPRVYTYPPGPSARCDARRPAAPASQLLPLRPTPPPPPPPPLPLPSAAASPRASTRRCQSVGSASSSAGAKAAAPAAAAPAAAAPEPAAGGDGTASASITSSGRGGATCAGSVKMACGGCGRTEGGRGAGRSRGPRPVSPVDAAICPLTAPTSREPRPGNDLKTCPSQCPNCRRFQSPAPPWRRPCLPEAARTASTYRTTAPPAHL